MGPTVSMWPLSWLVRQLNSGDKTNCQYTASLMTGLAVEFWWWNQLSVCGLSHDQSASWIIEMGPTVSTWPLSWLVRQLNSGDGTNYQYTASLMTGLEVQFWWWDQLSVHILSHDLSGSSILVMGPTVSTWLLSWLVGKLNSGDETNCQYTASHDWSGSWILVMRSTISTWPLSWPVRQLKLANESNCHCCNIPTDIFHISSREKIAMWENYEFLKFCFCTFYSFHIFLFPQCRIFQFYSSHVVEFPNFILPIVYNFLTLFFP